ncbi:MAG: penicillin acylase family protein [Proteobacteria bacterium]|nr:penicillin acylase family protein [Pseudomonadota bacterium]
MTSTTIKLPGAQAPIDVLWDETGIAHVFADNQADAYRGMGFAAGSERLWQIHLSTAYANGEAAALLGERFAAQDALQRACNVHRCGKSLPESQGDWIVDAYLEGLNGYIRSLDEVPPEFVHAGTLPRLFTRQDVAARYRFTSWFQHKSWTEKMLLGRLMATHGVDWFRNHVLHFSAMDETLIDQLAVPLRSLSTAVLPLAYPDVDATLLSGSNNWAVRGALSASGKPILATDPHQPHTIPNTFFYVHLHAGEWDAFGAAFPGVPYFMMGYTRDIAWGLTTGFVDCYDVYVEQIRNDQYLSATGWQPLAHHTEHIEIKGSTSLDVDIVRTPHGPLLESLTNQLGLSVDVPGEYQSALHWTLTDIPTSAGALAQLPLATSAEEFGHKLFEQDVCPLVNNIICVDRHNGLRRFIATTLPARTGVTGSVPLPGWEADYDFPISTEADLTVEIDPEFSLTANNDTMQDRGRYPIHNFPASSARADRIREILTSSSSFTVDDFKRAQLDHLDLRARALLPDLLQVLAESSDPDLQLAVDLLRGWDFTAGANAAAACLYYPFLDRVWHRKFMVEVLKDPLLRAIPVGAPGLNRFDIADFLTPGSPWLQHRDLLVQTIVATLKQVVIDVRSTLGDDPATWAWGDLHQISLAHRLVKHPTWQHMRVAAQPIGGSPTTLNMAVHRGSSAGERVKCDVYHGPAFRLIVDLADPDSAQLVIAGGNGGRPDSPFATNQFDAWKEGACFTVNLRRDRLSITHEQQLRPHE